MSPMDTLDPKVFGLCVTCEHADIKQPDDKRMIYVMCRNPKENPYQNKYPRVPVLDCDGYAKGDSEVGNQES